MAAPLLLLCHHLHQLAEWVDCAELADGLRVAPVQSERERWSRPAFIVPYPSI
ncbi:MAG: hypothetical protein IIX00_06185 [Tidjanibacter sp.]|nr:hypothetical protein [Tidjanibacter sp.]